MIGVRFGTNCSAIYDGAFASCSSLSKIALPKNISCIIGTRVFAGCPAEEVVIPNSVSSILKSAFEGSSFKTITFEAGRNSIPKNAPWGATNATVIDMNEQTGE